MVGSLQNSANTTMAEQSVEWLRGHHFGDTVSWIESAYYSHHQPQRGGTLAGGLPVAVSEESTSAPNTNAAGRSRAGITTPDRIVPGGDEPGHGPWASGNAVANSDLGSLLAGFNSGFRIADARGGFMAQGRTVGHLRDGAASLVISADGSLDVVGWTSAFAAAQPIAVRQNLDLIVDGGQLVTGLEDNTGDRWGRTVGNNLFVWRSGLGIDAQGRVIYVASSGSSVRSLATLLQRAGAVRAMELDINHAWVSFNAFHHTTTGTLAGTKLLAGMSKPVSRYLSPDNRDFIAVISNNGTPAL